MPAYLLIDNSNSFTKFAISTRNRIGEVRRFPTAKLSVKSAGTITAGWKFDTVVLCSVVPTKAKVLRKAFTGKEFLEVNSDTDLGIGIDYPEPRSIGADRLANAVAAVGMLQLPAIVVDFGTAVTFDILSGRGRYVGGVIAPGLEAMTDYLHQRTAQLPRITLREPKGVIGKSTEHAMLSGAVYGYRGLVREILLKIRASIRTTRRISVVATGGYAELIAAELPEIEMVHPKLTLEGLRLIGNRCFPKV